MTVNGFYRRQIWACVCGNILTAAHGALSFWPSANFLALQKPDTILPSGPLTVQEAALVMSIYYVGAVVGNLTVPHIVRKYGCKRVMLSVAIPQIIIWLLIIYAQNPHCLFATSILTGLFGAGQVISMPMFVTEISHDKIRGTLNAFYDPAYNLGAVFVFLLANWFNYVEQAKYLLILSVIFLILFARIPESPHHLINMEKHKAANEANKFFKGSGMEIHSIDDTKDIEDNSKLTLRDFTNRRARKAIFIAFSLVSLYSLQGTLVLTTYVTEIFASTNPNVSPLYASTIITAFVIFANLIFLNVVDRAGRRTFYIWSSIATAIGFTLFALYLCFLADNRTFDWAPVVCLSYALFANCMGMYPVVWLIIMETMPKKIKQYGYSNSVLLMLINGFVFTEIYPLLKLHIGLLGWIIVFATASFFSAVFGFYFLPETRGKSHEEIMLILDQ